MRSLRIELGKNEGRPLEEFYERAREAGFADNLSKYTPEGAERQEAVYERVKHFFKNNLMHDVKNGHEVLLVSHGGVIREFHRLFQNELKINLNGLKPFIVTPNTGKPCRLSWTICHFCDENALPPSSR